MSQFENYLVHEFVDDYLAGITSQRDMMGRVLDVTGNQYKSNKSQPTRS